MLGHLRSRNIYVQRQLVKERFFRTDPAGSDSVWGGSIPSQGVTGPNFVWHIDGLHCPISWRFVMHGGFDRALDFKLCSKQFWSAVTGLALFLAAVQSYRLPSRVCSDEGDENLEVGRATCLLWHRGFNRGSKIAWLSVHNRWIERLWTEVFIEVGQFYCTLFYQMEENGILESTSIIDLFCLYYIFLSRINNQLNLLITMLYAQPIWVNAATSCQGHIWW